MDNNKSILSVDEKHHNGILRGHVRVMLEDPETKERALWYENDNIIPISGTDVFLMKAFGLHLDSIHDPAKSSYENLTQDTNLAIPDLNEDDTMRIGINPDDYDVMDEDISSNYIIQGFMVGNGGSHEDGISTKNTDYCFINLKNPIPFQQSVGDDGLDPSIANSYLGDYRQEQSVHNYYIKKFDSRPHIVHSWYRENQAWDYVDPVKRADLGPNAQESPRSNRIESYVEAEMSINVKNGDCKGYFMNGEGQNTTAQINEIGLVAFDAKRGSRGIIDIIYNRDVKRLIEIAFKTAHDTDDFAEAKDLATVINADETLRNTQETHIVAFMDVIADIISKSSLSEDDWGIIKTRLESENNIHVVAYYKRSGEFAYATDDFITYVDQMSGLKYDEANRIKLVTYYTFNSIPLKENWNIIINYRIYAN